jgi:ribosomal protein S18 acetylase RimI-like enzyme
LVSVRRATPSDIPDLVDLMGEFYAESSFPLERAWATDAFSALLADPSCGGAWLIERNGALAGHVVLSVRFAMEFGGLIAYIDDLFVRPGHRRHGAARAGLEVLFDECRRRGCRSVHVEVDPANVAANALYRSYGLGPASDERLQLSVRIPPAG